jgi:ATP-dependent RNA helicase RhlE
MTFNDLGLIVPILNALETEGYKTPTPIQQQAIPIILKKSDILGCAQTGTGKTAAFAIPILQLLHGEHAERAHHRIKVLILTPTRELAIQIGESFAAYGRNLKLKHTVIFGGVPQGSQVQALKQGIDILIATPGRLLDLMSQGHINISNIGIFVLDEADRMLDMGFIHDVKKVVAKLPPKRQTLFFSATMPPEIQTLANTILVNPEKVEVTPVSSTADTVAQSLYFVDKKDKRMLLQHVLKDSGIERVLVFTRTKHGADKVVKDLHKAGIRAEAIHGNKSQNARQRALGNFKDGNIRALIATDIAARGIDVDSLSHVINYEIPEVPETYVHRIGRTGRAGASGIAISFCDGEELADLKNIVKLIGKQIPVVENHPYPMESSGQITINLPKNKAVVQRPNAVITNPPRHQQKQRNGGANNNNRNGAQQAQREERRPQPQKQRNEEQNANSQGGNSNAPKPQQSRPQTAKQEPRQPKQHAPRSERHDAKPAQHERKHSTSSDLNDVDLSW